MIRVTFDLHVVSKGDDGSYWLSDVTESCFREHKMAIWADSDEEARDCLRESFDAIFMRVNPGQDVREVIYNHLGISGCCIHQVRLWPLKIDLESELQ